MALPVFGYGWLANAEFGIASLSVSSQSFYSSIIKSVVAVNAPITAAITAVRVCARVSSGISPAMKVSIQGQDADGQADGVIKSSGNAYGTFTPSTGAYAIYEITLNSSYAPSLGEPICVVVEYDSGTVGFENYCEVLVVITGAMAISQSNRADASGVAAGTPAIVFKTASGNYGGMLPKIASFASVFGLTERSTTTSGNRVAAKVTLPVAAGIESVEISGFMMTLKLTSSQTVKAGIWDEMGVELASVVVDTDHFSSPFNNSAIAIDFPTPLTAAPGHTLYFGVESISSSSAKIKVIDFDTQADRDAIGSAGSSFVFSEWDGADWTDTPLDVPLAKIYLSEITYVSVPSEAEVAAAVWAYAERTLTA